MTSGVLSELGCLNEKHLHVLLLAAGHQGQGQRTQLLGRQAHLRPTTTRSAPTLEAGVQTNPRLSSQQHDDRDGETTPASTDGTKRGRSTRGEIARP